MSAARVIRVYICSTFDMRAERDCLRTVVFPALQAHGAALGFDVVEVDPLHDVDTERDAEDPRSVKRCLNEIDQCRPFFIALLGERYGTPLDTIPEDALAAYPALSALTGRSRLAVEITHALSGSPEQTAHLHFYLRRPRFLEDVPTAQRADFVAENEAAKAKLEELKSRVRSGAQLREYDCTWDTRSPRVGGLGEFAELVIRDLTASIDREASRRQLAELSDRFRDLLARVNGPADSVLIAQGTRRAMAASVSKGDSASAIRLLQEACELLERAAASRAEAQERTSAQAELEQQAAPRPEVEGAARPEAEASAVGTAGREGAEREKAPPYLDENVQFTVFRPQVVQPQRWYTMLAFAHLSEKRPDAEEDEPDPVEEVARQAREVLGKEFDAYRDVTEDSAQAVPREGELTFVPEVAGIEFNPKSRSFLWEEPVHREEFRLRAGGEMDGQTARGRLTVFLGSILLAEVGISIRVSSQQPATGHPLPLQHDHAAPYRRIFPSYSHRDEAIVAQFERYAAALGDEYLRDVTHLRAGEVWSDRLQEFIRDADVFQLFWSSNSMRSRFVRDEWEYALSLSRPDFVRPTYWEEPLPSAPQEELPPEALRRLHFSRIVTVASAGGRGGSQPSTVAEPSPEATGTSAPAPRRSAAPPGEERDVAAQPRQTRRLRGTRIFAYAASVAVLVGAVSLFTRMNAPPASPMAKKKIVLRAVHFAFDQNELRPDALPLLSEVMGVLAAAPEANILVEGHADASEPNATTLAMRRANAVRDYLIAQGIAAARIHVEARGASQPLASLETAEGRAQNARVEFRIQ